MSNYNGKIKLQTVGQITLYAVSELHLLSFGNMTKLFTDSGGSTL